MVTLFSNDSRLIKAVKDAVHPCRVDVWAVRVKSFPPLADVVVTMGQISKETEFLAMTLKASGGTIVLPEGAEWLSDRVADGRIKIMVGSDASRADRVF